MNSYKTARWERRVWALAVVLVCALAATGCNKLKARDRLNKGVAAYKNGLYDLAVEDFKEARDLDPSLINARLYLATAYAQQYVPNATAEDNIRKGNEAITVYKDVLDHDPTNLNAMDGIGFILFNMAGTPYSPEKFEESKSYHMQHIKLKPEDAEPYYWVAVIDWTLAFRANGEMRKAYNQANINKQIKDMDPLPARLRAEYAAKYSAMIDEGIQNVQEAIKLRPDYEEAMGYLNLLYRRKADVVESAEERDALQKQADELLDKIKEIRQKKTGVAQTS
ncbi:MAG: hypothetical protein ABSF92_03995 [Candidatus Acidiferrales bacterium]|jgi:tetratricopeptide (TPR) repeat protein